MTKTETNRNGKTFEILHYASAGAETPQAKRRNRDREAEEAVDAILRALGE